MVNDLLVIIIIREFSELITPLWWTIFAVNEAMGKRAIYKAVFESAALISASVLQVYLLRRLFEKKLGTSRV